MRTRRVEIVIRPQEDAFKEFAQAWQKVGRGEHINPKRRLGFPDISTFRKVLTEKRLSLLKAVRQYKPESVYGLAKLLHRDLKSVNTDIGKLHELGLITLKKTKVGGRSRTMPKVEIDNIELNIALV
jgi:predicted transcriptional regulator